MNLIFGQHEKLPNIYGHIIDVALSPQDTSKHDGAATNGAFSTTVRSGWSVLGGGSYGYRGPVYFQAKNTTGTGAGVYEDDAHVQTNNISCCTWLRKA